MCPITLDIFYQPLWSALVYAMKPYSIAYPKRFRCCLAEKGSLVFWDKFDNQLLRPMCSPNAAIYASTLWMLYERMVLNWYQSDWTPAQCREAIRTHVLELNQQVDWDDEISFVTGIQESLKEPQSSQSMLTLHPKAETDDSGQIYRYLRANSWIKEIDEIGYRRIAYMPKQASGLLVSLNSLTQIKKRNVGARCQNIYLALKLALENPKANALQVEVAAEHAREFCTQLSTMAASCRELAHTILEETNTSQVLSKFFNDFINGSLLEDYSKLKSSDHPYRYRAATLELVNNTLLNTPLMEALRQSLTSQHTGQQAMEKQTEVQLRRDLADIYDCFQRIDEIMQRIEHYRSAMTRRTREAMQYAMSAPAGLGKQLDSAIVQVSQLRLDPSNQVELNMPLFRDQHFGYARAFRPRKTKPIPALLPLGDISIPEDAIAYNRAMDLYYRRRSEDAERLRLFIERHLGDADSLTTARISIDSLDDFIAFLQLRDLLHDAVPPSSPFYGLLDDYRVESFGDEVKNQFVVAPELRIERRRKVIL